DWVRLTLPFLCLPVAFYGAQPLTKEKFEKFLQVFIFIMSVSLLCVLVWYGLHFKEFSSRLGQGTPIPTPHSHIRFSLLLVFAFFSSLWLREKMKFWWAFTLFLFIGVHLLSVRSALMSLYAGILFFAFLLMFNKQRLLGLVITVNTGILFVIAYTQIPSIQNRINYMVYDFEQFQNGNIQGFSDGVRFASMQAGLEMWQKNFWTGVGIGDIKQESEETMQTNFPSITNKSDLKMPHNQYLWTACATGVLGLSVFLFSFLFPLWYFRNEMDWLFIILQILFGTSFLVEYMLEGQVGGTFYTLFQSLFYNSLSSKKGV
ncbi:MAG TPA: O-antigen ligase family protein, partial [Chitinophagales bacterium]